MMIAPLFLALSIATASLTTVPNEPFEAVASRTIVELIDQMNAYEQRVCISLECTGDVLYIQTLAISLKDRLQMMRTGREKGTMDPRDVQQQFEDRILLIKLLQERLESRYGK